jgi:hypothetical protein
LNLPSPSTRTLPDAELAAIDPILRRIGLAAVVYRNKAQAHALVDQLFAAAELEYDPRDPASAPLPAVILDLRLCNAIQEQLGARNAGEFVALPASRIWDLDNIGDKRFKQLQALQIEWRAKIAAAGNGI